MRARGYRQHSYEVLLRQRNPHGVDFEFSPCTAIGTCAGGVMQAKCEARELGYDSDAAVLHVRRDKEVLRAHCYQYVTHKREG